MDHPSSTSGDVVERSQRFLEHDRHDEDEQDEEVPRATKPHSSPRDLFIHFELDYATHRICRSVQDGKCKQWDEVKLRSYNGKRHGPLIEAVPGDTLNITLENHLPPHPASDGDHSTTEPHGFNTTNLHFHGLHVSPTGNSDNVMVALTPGHRFEYEVKIPMDHPAGTYWYHAHKHGSATLQLASGLAGPLIIRGDIDKVDAIDDAEEQVILFQQIPYQLTEDPTHPGQQAFMVESYDLFKVGVWQTLGRRFTLNGIVEPTYEMCPGEVQRWRFIHGGIREMLQLRLVRRTGTQEFPLTQFQIAHDGITTGRIDAVTMTELHPGYRVDAMVRATEADGTPLPPGTYYLVDDNVPAPAPGHTLARVVVKGQKKKMRLPTEKELAPLAPFKPIQDAEITGQQQAVFSIDTSVTPPRFLINGKEFDPHSVRKLPLDAVQEWTVTSQNFNHPFHIHVNPFQLTTPDGKILWKDTLMVRSGQTFKLRTRYARYLGQFMMHCHIVEHGDLGMAEVLEVVPHTQSHGGHH